MARTPMLGGHGRCRSHCPAGSHGCCWRWHSCRVLLARPVRQIGQRRRRAGAAGERSVRRGRTDTGTGTLRRHRCSKGERGDDRNTAQEMLHDFYPPLQFRFGQVVCDAGHRQRRTTRKRRSSPFGSDTTIIWARAAAFKRSGSCADPRRTGKARVLDAHDIRPLRYAVALSSVPSIRDGCSPVVIDRMHHDRAPLCSNPPLGRLDSQGRTRMPRPGMPVTA